MSNTKLIVNSCIKTAAKICDDLMLNGYIDWDLPSKIELYLMNANINIGCFADNKYWATSEDTDNQTGSLWMHYVIVNTASINYKGKGRCVRAIRSF